MDYLRIYKEFISDRRSKEVWLVASGDYCESHHILPRCLGGDDNKDNLIRLTPCDHFFAHLLLAKAHGGVLWAPIAFMSGGGRKNYKPTLSRNRYAWARRELSKSMRGENCNHFDREVYCLVNSDGRAWSGLQSDMVNIGLSRSLANMLIKGRVARAKGWSMSGVEVKSRKGCDHPMYKSDIHHFVHIDGTEFIGTQYSFSEKHGVSKSIPSLLVNGKAVLKCGWHLHGADLSYRSGKNNNQFNPEVLTIKHIDGITFTGTRNDITKMIGGSAGNISMMLNGIRKSARGWSLD